LSNANNAAQALPHEAATSQANPLAAAAARVLLQAVHAFQALLAQSVADKRTALF